MTSFGTQNIRHSEHKNNLQSVLKLVQQEFPADLNVLAMQELTGSRKMWIREAMPGWGVWNRHASQGQNGTGLAWDNSQWAVVRKGLRMIYKPGRDGPVERYDGKEQHSWRRFASWVTLQDKATGKVCSFICIHGKLGTAGKGKQWAHLRRLVNHLLLVGPVQVAGDFNCWLKDLPDWLQGAVVLSDRIDHVAQFGSIKTKATFTIPESKLNNLVDHPGAAVRWSF